MIGLFQNSLNKLIQYCESENFLGYDPYDALNSYINYYIFGKSGPQLAIQLHKRNPFNTRPLFGIKKAHNPKGMGLLLKAYCILYKKTADSRYLEKADSLFQWLLNNYSKGYSGLAWGYNFDWASPGMFLPAFTPSVVVTSTVVDGIFEYFQITRNAEALKAINSASQYVIKDIPTTTFDNGIAFSYSHILKDCCYNASLLAVEVLAKSDYLNNTNIYSIIIKSAIDFVLSKQHHSGEWYYSYDLKTGVERKQIDFHQGFILISLANLNSLLDHCVQTTAIENGLNYYRNCQFFDNGQSLWRIPDKWPVDIHNQSQGIITFSRLKKFNSEYYTFAKTITEWTIKNMQDKTDGYFYYRKNNWYTNKISYMRWNQAWMMLALAEQLGNEE